MKIRNLMGAVLALAGVAFGGSAFGGGSIWDIVPVTPAGTYNPSDAPIGFTMRLLTPKWEEPEGDRKEWIVKLNPYGTYGVYGPYGSTFDEAARLALAELYAPFQLGIVANGKAKSSGAAYEGLKSVHGKQITELSFTYSIQCGDFALPLRAAADRDNNPIGAKPWKSGGSSAGEKYFFLNGPGDVGNEVWMIATEDGDEFDPTLSTENPSELRDTDRRDPDGSADCLRTIGYNIETIGFDDQKVVYDDVEYWRGVHEGSDGGIEPTGPQIVTYENVSPAGQGQRLYAWIAPAGGDDGDPSTWTGWTENDYAVTIPIGKSCTQMTFTDPDGRDRKHAVWTFEITSNKTSYAFSLKGQHKGQSARVILSATPHYSSITDAGAGEFVAEVDFQQETVLCLDPEAPTISVSLENLANPAEFFCTPDSYLEARKLVVSLNTRDHDAMKVKLNFKLAGQEGFPTNVIMVSGNRIGGFDPREQSNWLTDMEVTIQTNELEASDIFLFVLGATTKTSVPPGITITPVPEAKYSSFVEKTNSQYVVIRGMPPEIVAPLPATTVSCGTKQKFAIQIADSYRNLYLLENGTNGHYTVTWNRGIGAELTITNDFAGGPLVPDANGFLTIGVTYPQSTATNEYVSVFSVRNPEGLTSEQSSLTVRTKDPPVATAATADGSIQVIESDLGEKFVNIRFQLLPDASEAVDLQDLHVFLEPANEAASNRTDAAFLTTAGAGQSHGVPLFEGKGYTGNDDPTASGYEYGGLHILDGDDKATARYNVVLCESESYDAAKRVGLYASKTFSINLMNFAPAVDRADGRFKVVATGGSETTSSYGYHSETTKAIRTGHSISIKVDNPATDWNADVVADLFATNENQIVLRWLVYEVDANGGTRDPYDFFWTVGTNSVYELADGFDEPGIKKVVVQVQDKDMRDARCVVKEGGKWVYHMDPEDPDYDEWKKDKNKWGDEFVFYLNISDQPTIELTPKGFVSEFRNKPEFSESQVYPFPLYNGIGKEYALENGEVGFKMRLSAPYDTRSTLTFRAWVEGEGKTNDVTLATETVKGFRNNTETTATVDIPLSAFDGIYSEPGVPYKYTLNVQLVKAGTDESEAVSNHYVIGTCDFYVRNEAPLVMLTDRKQQEASVGGDTNSAVKCVKGAIMTIPYRIEDVAYDKTNELKVTCSTSSGGSVVGIASTNFTGVTGTVSGSFSVSFSSAGEQWALIEVTDKDGDVGEARVYFFVEANKSVFVYPAHPFNSAAGSDLIGEYLPNAGYGCAWANGSLGGIENFMQTWTYGVGSASAVVFARGYVANEQETKAEAANKNKAFVDLNGGNNDNLTGYSPSQVEDMKGRDSFFYRWFLKKAGGGEKEGEWTAVTPDPQVSKEGTARIKQTPLDLPLEQKDNVFADVSAYALFSREWLLSDNLGDINLDGVPDILVMQLKLTGGDFNEGKDLDDVNYSEDGKTPRCEDYLPLTEMIRYSKLIPSLTEYANIENAQAFTPRKKIRGYDDNLNDATARTFPDGVDSPLFVSGAKPDQIYEDPDLSPTSTLSKVEWLAWSEFKATHPDATVKDWSPERPTDPTKADTDNDGITDGLEYYWWYRAHVGYLDVDSAGREFLRKATGRRYNPRNPGEGDFIPSDEIERTFDPLTPIADIKQDTDNDGLPDLLEFEIGTNPFDFDTDGDGLPDGFEIMLGGTDPLLAETTKGISDAMRNFDGDAMAFTTPFLEQNGLVLPVPLHTDVPFTFALVDPKGDTDGIQWYVSKTAPANIVATDAANPGTSFTADGVTYVTSGSVPVVSNGTVAVLAVDLAKATTWTTTNAAPAGVETEATLFALMPTRIPAGTVVSDITPDVPYATFAFDADVKDVNAAWVYGRSVSTVTKGDSLANMGGFGMLTVGRYQDAKCTDASGAKVQIAALPAEDDGVAYLHHFVYQEFGFDPRTAWNANTPLAPRWGTTATSGDTTETVANNYVKNYGYAGCAARTREFTLYDEFLVLSFFLNNGKLAETDVTPTQARPWETIWSEFTTNGQGPNEPNWEEDNDHYKGRTAESNSGDNGADTDMDGVPDGWELYVMAGPKQKGLYHVVAPYNDGFYSSFGPFVKDAGSKSQTDNNAMGGNDSTAGDGDELTELQEFAGTDSCAYYCEPWGGNAAPFSATIVRPAEHAEWLNKFFPTDPWNKDTDGDGLTDNEFAGQGNFKCGNFMYGTPVDDGKMTAIPGGGLNPCTVDTDGDGLPDAWEAQYAGQLIYTGEDRQLMTGKDGAEGNPLQGLCDGMDGTVWDAYNSPRISNAGENYKVIYNVNGAGANQVVDRDYDRDGLENWQEYLTSAMRCWRYDDPLSPWDYIPYEEYFDELGGFNPWYEALSERAGVEIEDGDFETFLYYTLFDKTSPIYNPHFITDTSSGAQYFSRVTNGFDRAFSDAGTYYIFHDRVNDGLYKDLWGYLGAAPKKYIGTSPLKADSDKDGMDDYYELFHGLNPILGGIGVRDTSDNPCDLVFDAWYDEQAKGSPAGDAGLNVWRARSAPQDFILYPWMNGLVDADPDGDDIRNQDEAIMPMVAPVTTWYHTDPTPLWMTDSTYADSLVRRFFRMPVCFFDLEGVPESIIGPDGEEHFLRDCDGFAYVGAFKIPTILGADPDQWLVSDADHMNWLFSFEENEGFDADHDAISDFDEIYSKFRSKTDPQDFDSPRRRQAMYFPGPAQPSALQSLPFAKEAYPRAAMGYPDDMSLLQYTVECWVMPEAGADGTVADSTVIERAVYVNPSHCADQQYVRCNFRIAIKDGKWYTMFDANGTMKASKVEVLGTVDAKPGEWTYVAATYDTKQLTLYVNGEIDNSVVNSLKPAYGSSAVVLFPGDGWTSSTNGTVEGDIEASKGEPHNYWFDLEYELHAFLIGASFTTAADGSPHSSQLNVLNGAGWDGRYKDFFRGYVDEIRVWDGAQDAGTIASNFAYRVRFTREDALANRSAFYSQWSTGRRRYAVNGDGEDISVMPELRFHWSFDSVPGAENEKQVALAPNGFVYGAKPSKSSPAGYEIPWWRAVIDGYGSVYAGLGNWVTWIPNTVTHLPRFDLSTLDSTYWSENFAGDKAGNYFFARTAEPVSRWTQMIRYQTQDAKEFQTTDRRFWQSYNTGSNATDALDRQFEFTGRHLNLMGDDLLPLGGAFVKYVKTMWDDQGASSTWELTGIDKDGDGLPNWWQEYADQNYRRGLDPEEPIGWNTKIWYAVGGKEILITAGEAYQRDLAKGMYVDRNGEHHPTLDEIDAAREAGTDWSTDYAQTAKSDGMIPDWWKSLRKIDDEQPLADTDNDGLNNYHEYVASELLPFRLQLDPLKAKTQYGVLDYFRKIGSLYIGEMLTDHDQMEDHWERSVNRPDIVDATKWDALKDAQTDGWDNFSEARALQSGNCENTLVGTTTNLTVVTYKIDDPELSIFQATNQATIALEETYFSSSGWVTTSASLWAAIGNKEKVRYTLITETPIYVYDGHPTPEIRLTVRFDRDLFAGANSNATLRVEAYSDGLAADATWDVTLTGNDLARGNALLDLKLADSGYVRQGRNSFVCYALAGESGYVPGVPFGVVNDVEIGWASRDVEIELTEMSAITPRVDLWTDASDRGVRVNVGSNGIDRYFSEIIPTVVVTSNGQQIVARTVEYTNKVELTTAGAPDVHVTVSRYLLDGQPVGRFGLQSSHLVVLERDFVEEARTYLHEGDFLADGAIDIDWTYFASEVVEGPGVRSSYTEVTNVAYKVTFDWDSPVQVDVRDTNTVTKMLSTLITRRFEKTRTIPTPCSERSVHSEARPTFRWKIVGEDPWAAHFGTTYTGFKVRVKDLKGKLVYDSGVRRLPAKDTTGVYSWTAPLYVGEKAPGSDVVFQNLTDYTWEVALYNAKFATDDLISTYKPGNPFSKPEVFRMNVTELDTSTRSLAVRTCYTGPAAGLLDCVRVQAFASPDFTGDPIAETTLRYVDIRDSLSPEGTDANAVLAGLPEGSYFLRAYIDTNGNGTHDEWESWGYLNERDQASKPGIFNPVALTAAYKPLKTNVRKLFIEDCDTDGDFFPDVWEAEQNGGVFVKFLRGNGQGPVDGDAELIGINPELKAVLEASEFPMLEALGSKAGLALISGIPPTRISTVERSDGTLGISIDNKVESVKVTGFDFTAEGNVRIKIEAATTSGSVDGGVVALYGLSLTAEKKVTCNIYRKAKLSDTDWELAGSSEVVVGGEQATITVSKPVADNGGFYKAEIVEK